VTVLLTRVPLEAILWEAAIGLDGQGMPLYDSAVDLEARVVQEDMVGRMANGTEVRTTLTCWLPNHEAPLPAHDDRLVIREKDYLVVERAEGRRLDGALDHVRLRCREE
jgi:hypothetical protein